MAISNCTFTGNEAVGGNGANNSTESFGGQALGGAIANAAPLTITNSKFTDNLAKGGDGGDNLVVGLNRRARGRRGLWRRRCRSFSAR